MAHELATTNGHTAMMYAGETPWHGLGTKLNEPATAAEAIEAAGLNYQVELKHLVTDDGISVPQRRSSFPFRWFHDRMERMPLIVNFQFLKLAANVS